MDNSLDNPLTLNHRYQLEDRQAIGGMATVYRAIDLMLERTVAVKVLRTDLSEDPEFRERFRQEAKAAANLSHPNIVTVHDFGLDHDQLFIVMEFVRGTDLKTILKKRGNLPIYEALSLIIQACSGIGYAHRTGIVHCDIKPQNMLVTPEQHLKVVDFGIARAFASISPEEKSEIVWGSPQYFSPEQAAGLPPSPASDVYSLGVVLFEMLTGQPPFSGTTSEELARQHREVPAPSPRKYNPEIPVALEQIILKVLSKEPSARYRTADQMGRVLTTFVQQPGTLIDLPARQSAVTGMLPPQELTMQVAGEQAQTNSQLPVNYSKAPPQKQDQQSARANEKRSSPAGIDWITWLIVLVTILALGGLIPFWFWVYTILNPPF
jgi:serine/threonine protein kinase